MLDSETKRRIDTARDILVGKVPDPKSQVEQITIALIYKFMDDMDAESEELGGERKFFAGEFGKYGWAKLMRSGLGGHEMLGLYGDAIARMPENPGIPPLFRDIFKNAYLPYRDPETLRAFLKIIDDFTYDHSERLGDAFEYLLSVLGSQGDAGQFRTPRHIIDFMVSIVDPKKDETVLDPACGTAGFLISSYKHILAANRDTEGDSSLTPDERGRLAANFKGYDISPDMVRLSLVNLYLHGFTDPHIFEYDTLTSQERWNEHADVILANPPFMSPKGGIKPHNRFSVQSKRSEVLFVDYMAEHLTPPGRAGIIVPEGIVFQSQSTYRRLRMMLIESCLVAVVSLPAGVFNPYSGVKTSILILDRALAGRTDSIALFGVDNDGFDLGAQRKPINKDDLPRVSAEIRAYFDQLRAGESMRGFRPISGQTVPRSRLATDGEFNLSSRRYGAEQIAETAWPLVELDRVCLRVTDGSHVSPKSFDEGYPYVTVKDLDRGHIDLDGCKRISEDSYQRLVASGCKPKRGDVLFSKDGTVGKTAIVDSDRDFVVLSSLAILTANPALAMPEYLCGVLSSERFVSLATGRKTGVAIRRIVLRTLKTIRIPLPPLDVQKDLVTELAGYQRVLDGARGILENYRPRVAVDPTWPESSIGDCCEVKGGKRLPKGVQFADEPTNHPYIRVVDLANQSVDDRHLKYISDDVHRLIGRYVISSDDVYISIAGTIGLMGTVPQRLDGANLTENAAKLVLDRTVLDKRYLAIVGSSERVQLQIRSMTHAVGVPKLALERIKRLRIPIPPLAVQQALVCDVEAEEALVGASRELASRVEKSIQHVLGSLWRESAGDAGA